MAICRTCLDQSWKYTALTIPCAEAPCLYQSHKTIDCCWCFPFSPPDETDGPPGAIAMATMLLSLGKQVTMVTDRRALDMNQAIIDEAVRTGETEFEIKINKP